MISPRISLGAALVLVLASASLSSVSAQTAPRGNFSYSAAKLSYRANGVRLDGTSANPARIKSPQLEASAQAIAFDLAGNSISQVRALTNVDLKVNLTPKGGGKSTRVEVRAAAATLTTATRTLVLRGNLSGFYQEAGGPRNTLRGENATLRYVGENLVADVEGGANGVQFSFPASAFGTAGTANGTIVISAKNARLDESAGTLRLTGEARAISSGGTQNFDVAASEFLVTRGANGQLNRLQTVGRTNVKLDLPPEPTSSSSSIGRPTRVEVAANKATVDLTNSSAVFEGAVKGFYRLQPATGEEQNYNFSGETATIRYDEKAAQTGNGLSVEVAGGVEVEAPSFEF